MSSSIQLDSTFTHSTATHSYTLKYTSLGPPVSPSTPPLIFVHGTPWSHKYWIPFAQSLSSNFHIYLFDNPGFGVSPGGTPLPSTSPTRRDDLDASLRGASEVFAALYHRWQQTDNWNTLTPHVIAHDNGGLISLRANLLHDCVYASLCLIDVVAVPPFGSPFFKLVGQHVDVFNSIPEHMFEGLMESYIRDAAYSSLSAETMAMLKQPWLSEKGGMQGTKGFVRQMHQADQRDAEDVAGRYGEFKKSMAGRANVIWGRDDKWIPKERGETLAEMMGAEFKEIGEAGHLVHFDQPGRLGVELGWWLARMSK